MSTVAISVLTRIAFGVGPSWQAAHSGVNQGLKEGGTTASRRRKGLAGKGLIVIQVALCTLLLVSAGLFVRTFTSLIQLDPGFNKRGLLLFAIEPPQQRYPAPKDAEVLHRIEERLATLPGVESASLSREALLAQTGSNSDFIPVGRPIDPGRQRHIAFNSVGQSFFKTMGISILNGRQFDDSWFVESVNPRSPQDVITLVNRLNEEGVKVYRRLSPSVLVNLMSIACDQSADFHESLDPFERATFNVSWAGEEASLNWFDTARELIERWHHQQQIRLATGRPGIMKRELYHPVLDCFVRGLPHSYRRLDAPAGTSVLLEISGECGGTWALSKEANTWGFVSKYPKEVDCRVTLPEEIAWRMFTKGIPRDSALAQVTIEGNEALAAGILQLTAIVG